MFIILLLCFWMPLTQFISTCINSLYSYSSVQIIPSEYARSYLYCILPSYKMEKGCVKTIIQIQLFYHTVRNHFIEDIIEREGFFRLYRIFCSCRNVSLVRQATFRDKNPIIYWIWHKTISFCSGFLTENELWSSNQIKYKLIHTHIIYSIQVFIKATI